MVRHHHEEKSAPIGTIVGIAVCVLALGGFLLLVKAGVIGGKKPSNAALPPPTSTTGNSTNTSTPTVQQPGTPPAGSSEVRVVFEGRFGKDGDTRKVVYKCPFCQASIVDVPAPNCLSCSKGIKWPTSVACGFCEGSGKCSFCKGDGKCPDCSKGGRMLMGVKPPCDTCGSTGKCPACNGTGVCPFCESGKYFPGKPKSSGPKTEEPPPPIPKPQP
jgi:hypothetical protein